MATEGRCIHESFSDRVQARNEAKEVQRALRIETRPVFCEVCDAYHVFANDRAGHRITTPEERLLLRLLAQGLYYHEIAKELDTTYFGVRERLRRIKRKFGSISDTNLVATIIFLGIININDIMPEVKPSA